MTAGDLPVDVSVRFERFPATVKGAFVMRGADGDPHGIRMEEAAVARVPQGPTKPMPMDEMVVVDVAPARDLFVPFEVSVSDLEPGWYAITCRIKVDAGRAYSFSSRPFPVAWPRGHNRRGVAQLGRSVRVGGARLQLDRVEMAPDHALVAWRVGQADPEVTPVLTSGDDALDPLPPSAVAAVGRASGDERRAAFYPVPRASGRIRARFRLASGDESAPVDVPTD
ncbi:MAG TPA: hypothetical protein VKA30_08060 [Actinomycetota bacterium]|nr:hypothetical protein [Actinomycetota bacterium]